MSRRLGVLRCELDRPGERLAVGVALHAVRGEGGVQPPEGVPEARDLLLRDRARVVGERLHPVGGGAVL